MAACGLTSSHPDLISSDGDSWLKTMAHFAATMCHVLERLNSAKSQNFQLRIGELIHDGTPMSIRVT